jgi:hypothetical protein
MPDTFFDHPNKPVRECGAARVILEAAGFEVAYLRPAGDPPDCEGMLSGQLCAVVTHEETRARNMAAIKARAAGREPDKAEADYLWDREDLIAALNERIEEKDGAVVRYKGGPYERKILVIHTDESVLNDPATVTKFLEGATFPARQLTDAVLGLSYCPRVSRYPTFQLNLSQP